MTLNRRNFMVGSVGAAALARLTTGCSEGAGGGDQDAGASTPWSELALNSELFEHGVASGDPSTSAVILWTRLSGQSGGQELRWVVANDEALQDIVSEGKVSTDADRDFTAQVDADGLSAGGTYYYAFALGNQGRSVVGRARTLPGDDVEHVRFAFTSCANYNNGFFHAYRAIAQRSDLDVWIHLGDYIYEYAEGVYGDPSIGRTLDPLHEILTVDDYRTRYAQARKDPDLQELHRRHTCIVVWDDHEVANDAWRTGAENHMPEEGDFQARYDAGTQVFKEWIPLRLPDSSDPRRIFRTFEFGKLFDLIMIDTRLYARDQPAGGLFMPGDPAVWVDPSRQLLGEHQEEFVKEQLSASRERGATWRVLGNQVMFAETRNPLSNSVLNSDAWDGYQPARERIVSHIKSNGIDNLVVITGDIHTSWALDLAENPYVAANYDPMTGRGSFGVELVGPSVTSLGIEDQPELAQAAPFLLPGSNPHLKYVEVTRKGYVLVDVQEERVQAEWYFIGDHKKNDEAARAETLQKTFVCVSGSARLTEGTGASPAKG
jgi:alkaline phosphatase D